MPAPRKRHIPFILVVLGFLLWGGAYIWNTSFPIHGTRYFCLFDDGMISMRYAHNLAAGQGLVWNPGGERVEGFSNPLWTALMALIHAVGFSQNTVALYVQLVGLLFLTLNLWCVYRITLLLSNDSGPCAIAATILTAFYLPLNTWGLQGMEVSLVTFLIHASMLVLISRINSTSSLLKVFFLLGLGVCTRPDGIVPYLVTLGFIALFTTEQRRRRLLLGASILTAILVSITLLRHAYYGEILPNTYYLKMTGIPVLKRITRGLDALVDTLSMIGLVVVAFGCAAALAGRKQRPVVFLALMVMAHAAYSVYVGGDAWEWFGPHYANRYLSVAMPSFFILLAMGAERFLDSIAFPGAPGAPVRSRAGGLAAFAILITAFWLSMHGATSLWTAREFSKSMRIARGSPLHAISNSHNVALALWLRSTCPDNIQVAVIWAGSFPYFSNLPTIDLLGKCDKKIARMTVSTTEWRTFIPGHNKSDAAHSVDTLRPEVIINGTFAAEYPDYVLAGSVGMHLVFVRKDKPEVLNAILSGAEQARANYLALCAHWNVRP